ncbi:MAG: restriction endonuclease subunit R [Bacteroidetes bacterium]|nr:MAG: restriction endonuclease subunit R [Bacteroidota bacterium]
MATKFFTNKNGNTLIKKFEGTLSHVKNLHYFDALVGYFRASGYFKLRPFLQDIPKIRILVGINVDTLTQQYHNKGQQYIASTTETKQDFLDSIIQNIQDADYDEATEKGIIQFLEDLESGKIEMRAHPKQKIHAKIYIFRPNPFNEYTLGEVITGSSNLTDSGMGTFEGSNYEFNVSLRDYEDVKFATDEFEVLWEESVPILKAEAETMRQNSYLKPATPFELYIKTLIEYFGKRVEYDPYNIDLLLPDSFKKLKYQSDAANQGYAIMMKHHGFILADVVGLGKTIIACMVIKKFIYENGTHTRILVVAPPAIQGSWKKTVQDFQIKNHFEFITIGSLDKILNPENHDYSMPDKYDLIVVDESHKFRNDYTNMYGKLQEICKTPRSKPAEDGDTRKKVILISATPMNNRPQDIENQLYLFQDKRNSTLESTRNIQEYFKPINKKYEDFTKKLKQKDLPSRERELTLADIKRTFRRLREDIIEPLVIRRTRTDIQNNEDYLEDLKKQGIEFPKVDDPNEVYYYLEGGLSQLFYDTISLITGLDEDGFEIEGLGYYRYRAIEFLKDEADIKLYGNVESISLRLSAIMRTLLVKRLESSFYAFKVSLGRLQTAIDNMLEMFAQDTVFIAPDLNVNQMLEEGLTYEEIEAKIENKGGNNRKFLADAFRPEFLDLLKKDKTKIDKLVARWAKVENDPKMEVFLQHLKHILFQEKYNHQKKLVIFSESKDTLDELREAIAKHTDYRVLTVSSENRKQVETTIYENFDANRDLDKQKNDYDIIITTEVLAEGVNLHRSNIIVNYDVPWNATRLMQRIGRVNRIGTTADQIYVYNFYPSAHGDEQISLVNNALRKLQAFHTAFGEDNKIFSVLEEKHEGALYGNKIQKEESEILIYLNELRDFKKKHPKRFQEIAKIPNKSRCGRSAVGKEYLAYQDELQAIYRNVENMTISYLKSENHPGIFCLVLPNLYVEELGFLQAVQLLKATEKDESLPLHDKHYEQARNAFEYFKQEKVQNDITQSKVTAVHLSPAENKALSNLNAILKTAPTEQKKKVLQEATKALKAGTFKNLPTQINDFFKKNEKMLGTKTNDFIDALFIEVLDKYDFQAQTNEEINKPKTQGLINPQIVLTQSFQ